MVHPKCIHKFTTFECTQLTSTVCHGALCQCRCQFCNIFAMLCISGWHHGACLVVFYTSEKTHNPLGLIGLVTGVTTMESWWVRRLSRLDRFLAILSLVLSLCGMALMIKIISTKSCVRCSDIDKDIRKVFITSFSTFLRGFVNTRSWGVSLGLSNIGSKATAC